MISVEGQLFLIQCLVGGLSKIQIGYACYGRWTSKAVPEEVDKLTDIFPGTLSLSYQSSTDLEEHGLSQVNRTDRLVGLRQQLTNRTTPYQSMSIAC
jgi:hypothetical protein